MDFTKFSKFELKNFYEGGKSSMRISRDYAKIIYEATINFIDGSVKDEFLDIAAIERISNGTIRVIRSSETESSMLVMSE